MTFNYVSFLDTQYPFSLDKEGVVFFNDVSVILRHNRVREGIGKNAFDGVIVDHLPGINTVMEI